MAQLREGDLLDGRYRIGATIAHGGMSTVYRAVDLRLGREVAAKVMDPRFVNDHAFRARFEREARAVAHMSDESLVNVYDQGSDAAGNVFLIMELVDGGTLRELLRERGPMPPHAAAAVMRPVLRALSLAHSRDFVHRDIKPENVLISDSGRVKLADFGLVRAVADAKITSNSVIVGTAAYLSPEQVTGEPVQPESDVFSAGILLFELLTGSAPFEAETSLAVALKRLKEPVPAPSEYIDGVPPEFDDLVARACARNPEDRFADAAEFAEELDAVVDQLGLPAFRVPAPKHSAAHRSSVQHTRQTAVGTDDLFTEVQPQRNAAQRYGAHPYTDNPYANQQHADNPYADNPYADQRFDDYAYGDSPSQSPQSTTPGHTAALPGHTAALPGIPQSPVSQPGADAGNRFAPRRTLDVEPADDTTHDDSALDTSDTAETPAGHSRQRQHGQRQHGQHRLNRERTRRGCALWIIIVLIATLGMGLGAWWLGSGRYGEVPSITGLSQSDAESTITSAGFTAVTEEKYHDTVPKSQTIGTDPGAGQQAVRGETVAILVSLGRPTVPAIPANYSPERFSTLLKERTLSEHVGEPVYSDTVPAGLVVRANPASGQTVPVGSSVIVHLSKGPAPVKVPDVVGLTLTKATAELEEKGLTVGSVEKRYVRSADADEVLEVTPKVGTGLERGSEVSLVVNSGLEVPDVVGMDEEAARKKLTDAGFDIDEVKDSKNSNRDYGKVDKVSPAPGKLVAPEDAKVTLTVSRSVKVPQLLGLTVADAREKVESLGLKLKVTGNGKDDDRVLTQSPRSGERLTRGDSVKVRAL